jgi:hypothetical protein
VATVDALARHLSLNLRHILLKVNFIGDFCGSMEDLGFLSSICCFAFRNFGLPGLKAVSHLYSFDIVVI